MRPRVDFGQMNSGLAWLGTRLVAVPVLVLVGACAGGEPAQQIAYATKANVACPSQDFSKFMQAFSDSADLQRRFTSLPLEYGRLDTGALGTPPGVHSADDRDFRKDTNARPSKWRNNFSKQEQADKRSPFDERGDRQA